MYKTIRFFGCIKLVLSIFCLTSCQYFDFNGEQNEELDDLYVQAKNAYDNKNYKEAKSFALRMMPLVKELDIQSPSSYYYLAGNIEYKRDNLDSSANYFFKALENTSAEDHVSLARCFKKLGLIYKKAYDYTTALEYFGFELAQREIAKNTIGIADTYYNSGLTFRLMKSYDSALYYQKNALSIYQALEDHEWVIQSTLEIANLHMAKGDFDQAEAEYLKILQSTSSERIYAKTLTNLGTIYLRKQDLDKSEEYYLKALKLKQKLGNWRMASTLISLGDLYIHKGDPVDAIERFELVLSGNLDTSLEQQEKSLRTLIELNEEIGEYSEASAYKSRLIDILSEKTQRTVKLTAEHSLYEIKNTSLESENERLSRENIQKSNSNTQMLVLILIALVVISITSFLTYHFRKDRNEYKDLAGALKENYRENYLKVRELSQSQGQGD